MSRAKGRALWLPDVLRDAGLRVEVTPGWEHRGKEPTEWLAQVNHHTASNRNGGPHPSLGILQAGRSDVPGPLSNTSPGRDGVIRIIAAGAANHPGVSYLPLRGGISSGVKYFALGHEVELDGVGEPFPVGGPQYESVSIMNAAICIYLGLDPATTLFDHKFIARPRGRKIDIRPYDLPTGRARCARRMTGQHPAPVTPKPTIPQEDDMTPDQVVKLNQAAADVKAAKDMVAELYDQLIGKQDDAKTETLRQLIKEGARDAKAAAQQTRTGKG